MAKTDGVQPDVDVDEQYVLIDKFHQSDTLHNDLKPLAALLKTPIIHAALNPTGYDLYKAIREDRLELATRLVNDRGVNVNFVDEHDGEQTCLHVAARSSNPAFVQLLLSKSSCTDRLELDAVSAFGVTPLMIAAAHGKHENVRALLAAGANTEIAMSKKRSSLDDVFDIDQQNTFDSTALVLAAQHGHADVVTTLLEYNADVHVTTNLGFTPLIVASIAGSTDIVKALLKADAGVDATANGGFTALIYAANMNHVDVARILLDNGANIEARKELDMTPLLEAVWCEHVDMVRFLLGHGADTEVRSDEFNDDITRFTPLMMAANDGNEDIVAALLEANAKVVEPKSGADETALDIAERLGHEACVDILLAAIDGNGDERET